MDNLIVGLFSLFGLIIIILVIVGITSTSSNSSVTYIRSWIPRPYPVPYPGPVPGPRPGPLPRPLIGGCAGTRYGCCPNSTISKRDERGSNCLLY